MEYLCQSVRPLVCKKNFDRLYTGLYASWIIWRLIKPTWWPNGIPWTPPWPPGTPLLPMTPKQVSWPHWTLKITPPAFQIIRRPIKCHCWTYGTSYPSPLTPWDQAMTGSAFWLRVELGLGLTEKSGFWVGFEYCILGWGIGYLSVHFVSTMANANVVLVCDIFSWFSFQVTWLYKCKITLLHLNNLQQSELGTLSFTF